MTKNVDNVKGNVGIAIVVVLISLLSGITMASISFRDSLSFRIQLDAIQEFHLLRSEVGRGRMVASHYETLPSPPLQSILPTRSVPINFDKHRTIYSAKTKIEVFSQDFEDGYNIRSLITAVRGNGKLPESEQLSPVRRYGENRIMSLHTIALFHYFTNIDRYIDDREGGIVFYGGDEIWGRVHSNSDIWIDFSMAGRWPIFHGLVSTGGLIKVNPGGGSNYPREEVFRGPAPGLIENYPKIAFEPSAERVRNHGRVLYGGVERDDTIAYVTVDGSAYHFLLGTVVTEQTPPRKWIEDYNQFTIYSSYPPYGPVGDSIGVNRIPHTDTVWADGPSGTLSNGSVFVPMELWISGNFGGRQTWASSHDIYLKGDLTYKSTPVGQRPDGIDSQGNPTLPVNRTDYLGVISEKSMYIQYGHWNPIDSIRVRPNTEDIYMYGAYCAVGESENAWEDGIFTFEYRRPKGSTPPQYWRGERFSFIDLHLFHYPTTTTNPWPPGLDYPWYNPLWPEPGAIVNVPNLPAWTPNPHNAPEVVELRGYIYIFGSIAQRRRGAVGIPPGNMFDVGIWDIDNVIMPYDPPRYGASSPGRTGYDKRYTTDMRFEKTGPPHYPIIRFEGYESDELRDLGYLTLQWKFKKPPTNF